MSLTSIPKKIPFTFRLQQHTRLTTPPHPHKLAQASEFVSYLLKSPKVNTRSYACSNSSNGYPDVHYTYSISMHVYLFTFNFLQTSKSLPILYIYYYSTTGMLSCTIV